MYYPQSNYGYGGGNLLHPMLQNFNFTQQENKQSIKEEIMQDNTIDDNELKDITKDIIETMNDNKHDERFEQSEFLKFMKKLHNKEILLEEKTNSVVENKNYNQNAQNFINKEAQQNKEDIDKMFEKVLNEVNQNFDNEEDIYEYMKQQEKPESIFEPDNKYLSEKEFENVDLVELAKKLILEGKSQEAKRVLEAECQKNGDNTEAWTILGRIHSENDCDSLAYQCLLRALDVDPFNLEAELALGILCTNEFDELDAMIHLKNWIRLHPIYSKYIDDHNPLLNEKLIKEAEITDFDQEDVYLKAKRIETMRNNFYIEMINLMENIYKDNPKDSNLLISLGIANFIPNNNEKSIQYFKKAVEANPKDYNAWNKLGAIFAHSKHHEEAINCYKRAVELKPDYVRSWANFGIAFYNVNNFEEGAKCYLKALSICPSSSHIWSYLRSLILLSKRGELLSLVEQKNINELCKIFKIV
jgi:peroxin-5